MKKVFTVIFCFLGVILTFGGISGMARYFEAADGDSAAVIGGTDGPTAIYLTGPMADESLWSLICITVVGIVTLIATLLFTRHRKKK